MANNKIVWLNVGIPVLILICLIAARLVYYVLWRKHWDRRPERKRAGEPHEVIIVRETESQLGAPTPSSSLPLPRGTNDPRR